MKVEVGVPSSAAVRAVRPQRRDSVTAVLTRHWGLVQVGVLIVLGVVLLLATYALYPRTATESYVHEVVIAGVGALVTVSTAVIAASLTLWREIRGRREHEHAKRFDAHTWRTSSIRVGRMEIPDIAVVASCGQGREWTSRVRYEFEPLAASHRADSELAQLRANRLPEVQRRAQEAGLVLTNDPCVDLVGASLTLARDAHGRRTATYRLVPAQTTYFDFVVSSADLDGPAFSDSEAPSLRDHWDEWPTSIEEVGRLPAPAKVGVGTAVVTSDGRLVLGVRGRTFMVGRTPGKQERSPVHVAAEGMLPSDLNIEGRLDPRESALRALREELNIGAGTHDVGRVRHLTATGFFFDQSRWQPCFSYLAEVDLTWDELQTVAPMARDYWEVERLQSFPFDVRSADLRHLLTGTHPQFSLASNHAAAVLWFALLHRHGLFQARDALADSSSIYYPGSGEAQVGRTVSADRA
jgi:hypothetical protein